jgi:hypothetical protein
MELALAALPGVITSCLLAYVLKLVLDRHAEERQAHRIEIDVQRQDNASVAKSHREEIAALNQARIEEVANLLQRIQAPEVAVAEHATRDAFVDPPPVDLEDDGQIVANAQQRLEAFAAELEGAV